MSSTTTTTTAAADDEGRGAVLHELWDDGEYGLTFCLAGPYGDLARSLLSPHAVLVWTVEARNHEEAMNLYYKHMGWAEEIPHREEGAGHTPTRAGTDPSEKPPRCPRAAGRSTTNHA